MIRTSARRAFRCLVIAAFAAVALLPALAQPVPAAASSDGKLFGLGASGIVKVDPTTGALTTFGTLSFPNVQGYGSGLASDPTTHRLFLVQNVYVDQTVFPPVTASQIVTIDSQTGAVTASPNLTDTLVDLVYDSSSKTLIGLTDQHEIVRVDPATSVITPLAALTGDSFSRMAMGAAHTVYLASISFATFPPGAAMLTVSTLTGAVLQSPALNTGVVELGYDASSGSLFGKTFCCPASLVRIDPVSGTEAAVGPSLGYGSGFAIDSASHTIFLTDDELGAFSFTQFIQSINDQTGALSVSGALPSDNYVSSLVFEPVGVTPDSIKADVRNALASGAIGNAGVANSLLAKLDAAENARSRNGCAAAANIYQAFINELNAQSGKHVASSTAGQLISEAQFLIANCP